MERGARRLKIGEIGGADLDYLDNVYRLQTFQLGRLHHALAQRDYATSKQIRFLVDTCISSLYISCIDAGVGEQARVLIGTYRKPVSTGI